MDLFLAQVPVEIEIEDILRADVDELADMQQHYLVFTFEQPGSPDNAHVKQWDGILLLQDPSAVGELVSVKFLDEFGNAVADRAGNVFIDWWYENHDGSISKIILDGAEQAVGVLTVFQNGTISAKVDVNGDRIVDMWEVILPDLGTLVVVNEMEGIPFFDDLLQGHDPLCGESALGHAGSIGPGHRLASFLFCGSGSGGAAAGGGGGTRDGGEGWDYSQDPLDELRDSQDPLDDLCQELLAGASPGSIPAIVAFDWGDTGVGAAAGWLLGKLWDHAVKAVVTAGAATADAAVIASRANAVGVFLAVTLTPATAGASPCELGPAGACADWAGESSDGTASEEVEFYYDENGEAQLVDDGDESDEDDASESGGAGGTSGGGSAGDSSGGGSGPGTSQPCLGPDCGTAPDDWMEEFCQKRAEQRLARRWMTNARDAQTTLMDNDCEDAVINPNPAESDGEAAAPCREEPERTDLESILRRASGQDCSGPTMQPGPEGPEGGSEDCPDVYTNRGSGGSRVIIAIGLHDLVGIEVLPPPVVNPDPTEGGAASTDGVFDAQALGSVSDMNDGVAFPPIADLFGVLFGGAAGSDPGSAGELDGGVGGGGP